MGALWTSISFVLGACRKVRRPHEFLRWSALVLFSTEWAVSWTATVGSAGAFCTDIRPHAPSSPTASSVFSSGCKPVCTATDMDGDEAQSLSPGRVSLTSDILRLALLPLRLLGRFRFQTQYTTINIPATRSTASAAMIPAILVDADAGWSVKAEPALGKMEPFVSGAIDGGADSDGDGDETTRDGDESGVGEDGGGGDMRVGEEGIEADGA